MAWHLQIGIDEGILYKIDSESKERQLRIFSIITLMIIVVGIIVLFSSIIYLLIIFHNWWVAICGGLFLALVTFNLYRLLIVTAINGNRTSIAEYHSDHEKQYDDFINVSEDFGKMTDESIAKIVNVRKDELREKSKMDIDPHQKKQTHLLTMAIRVILLAIIAFTFATGLELFIFRGSINITLDEIKSALSTQVPDSWLIANVFTPEKNQEFILFNCNSLLMLIDVLKVGLGYWKLLIDVIILFIFMLPLILIFKSKEILNGDYVKELVLHEISISFYHFLKTQKSCSDKMQELKNENLEERLKKADNLLNE
jgi:hypothetical protein